MTRVTGGSRCAWPGDLELLARCDAMFLCQSAEEFVGVAGGRGFPDEGVPGVITLMG